MLFLFLLITILYYFWLIIIFYIAYTPNTFNNIPAAIADHITPDTFGDIACINKKFEGSSSCPTFWATLDDIGTA